MSEIRVNRKFVIVLICIATVLTFLNMYALLSPKSVTVEIKKKDSSYFIEKPLEITVPNIKR